MYVGTFKLSVIKVVKQRKEKLLTVTKYLTGQRIFDI